MNKNFRICLLATIAATTAQAQDQVTPNYCATVLQNKVFNQTSLTAIRQYGEDFYNHMCSTNWNSKRDFSSRASSFGISFSDAVRSFGLTNKNFRNKNASQAAYQSICQDQEYSVSENTYFQRTFLEGNRAVDAWEACVRAELANAAEGIFATSYLSQDFKTFNIKVEYKTQGVPGVTYDSIETAHDVACTKSNRDLVGQTITQNAHIITCRKPSISSVQFALNTNRGPLGIFEVPGLDLRLQDLQKRQSALESDTEQQFSTVNKHLSEISAVTNSLGNTDKCYDIGAIQKTSNSWIDFTCKSGFYLRSVGFQHDNEQDLTYHERVRASCCPISTPASEPDNP